MAEYRERVAELTRSVLSRLGYPEADVDVEEDGRGGMRVRSHVEHGAGILIGKGGETLRALQHLLLLLASKQTGEHFGPGQFVFDINDYQKDRESYLVSLAKNTAYEVRESRRPKELTMMPPAERRVIHVAVAGEHGVTTESIGERGNRRVVVRPV